MDTPNAEAANRPVSPLAHAGLLAGVLLLGLALRLAVFTGFERGDDMQYITNAYQLAEGRLEARYDFAQARLAMTGPLALLFRIFGPGLGVVVILPLAWSLGGIVLAYVTGRVVYRDSRVGLLGAALLAIYPLDVLMATQYFPNFGAAVFLWAAFLCLFMGEKETSTVYYFGAGFAFGLALLYHETAIFALLPLLLYLVYRRRWDWRYVIAGFGFLAAMLIETATFAWLFGDPLYRIRSVGPIATTVSSEAARPIRPGGPLFSPVVALVTNHEYGLFPVFVVFAAVGLMRRQDRPSAPLLVFLICVACYTLWGTVKISRYQPLRPWPRYTALVTIPVMLLIARWIMLLARTRWRCALLGVLVLSSALGLYLDNSRTARSLGNALHAFWRHQEKLFVVPGHAYMDLFIANNLKPPADVEILGKGASGHARRINPSIRIWTDETALSDCYVAVALEREASVPSSWKEVTRCTRTRRWFVAPLERWGGVWAWVASRLSPAMGFVIYYVPPVRKLQTLSTTATGVSPAR